MLVCVAMFAVGLYVLPGVSQSCVRVVGGVKLFGCVLLWLVVVLVLRAGCVGCCYGC